MCTCKEGVCKIRDLINYRNELKQNLPELKGRLTNGSSLNQMIGYGKQLGESEATIKSFDDVIQKEDCKLLKHLPEPTDNYSKEK